MFTLGVPVAVLAVIAAYGIGYLVGGRSATLEKCQAKIDEANHKRAAAESSARMWRARADRLQERIKQIDVDVTASTEMLLAEIDAAAGADVCPHGKRAGCDWCDTRPRSVVTL